MLETTEAASVRVAPRPRRGKFRAAKMHTANLRLAHIAHTLLFCGALFAVGVLSLLLPKPTVSEVEKRTLAPMPAFRAETLLEGSYVRGVELHYADTFPWREGFVRLAAFVDSLRGVRYDDVKIYGTAPAPERPPAPASEPQPPRRPAPGIVPGGDNTSRPEASGSEAPPAPREIYREADDGASGEQNGAVFVYKEKGMSIFGGSEAMGEWYASVVNEYAKAWAGEAQVYNIVVPTAIEFALPERLKAVTSPQKPNIDHIYQSLDPLVKAVDAYTEIGVHAGEYVYFNADHHWTGLGAYYAYRAYCETAGLTPLALSDYETKRIEDFYGTMYTYTNDAKLAADYVDYYLMPVQSTAVRYDNGAPDTPVAHSVWAEYAKSPNCYAVFLHGDFPLTHISTQAGTGRRALVVKESFGNAFAPFLIPHYDEVYVVDQRYFEKNLLAFVRENNVDDVIFINNVFAANTGSHIEWIAGMMK